MNKITSGLCDLTAKYLVKRLEGMLGESGIALQDGVSDEYREELKTDHRTEIFIYGTDITLRLQIFFNIDEQKARIDHMYNDGASDERVNDFFNELANMTCGKVKEEMVKQGVSAALSLPVAIPTIEIKKRAISEILTHAKDSVLVKSNHALLASRVSLAIHNQGAFAQFNMDIDDRTESAGDIELF